MKWNFSVKLNTRYVFAEVARTRLREEGSKYRSFWQTLHAVYQSEGRRGLYRGLATQLIRQIPNTAIMMSTYELTVYVLIRLYVLGKLSFLYLLPLFIYCLYVKMFCDFFLFK